MKNPSSQFNYFYAEFSDRDLERSFRRKYLNTDKLLNSVIIGLTIISPIFFGISDAIYFRDSPQFYVIESLRFVLITFTIVVLIVMPKIQEPRTVDLWMFCWLLVTAAIFLYINFARPAGFTVYRLSDILTIFCIYIAIQTRPILRLFGALFFTVGSFVIFQLQSGPIDRAQLTSLIFVYPFANIISICVCWSAQMGRRTQYGNYRLLTEEIEHKEKIAIELQTSEERYRQLVALSPVAILVHRDGQILFANPAAIELVRAQSQEEVIGRHLADFLVRDDRARVTRHVQKVAKTKELVLPEEVSCRRLDGVIITIEVSAASIEFEGEPARLVLFRDVTERNLFEDKLKGAKETAEEASRAKSQFLATMSHELRTPLNAINGFAELLQGEHEGVLNEKQHEVVDHIEKSGQHLLDLITDLLDVSKIDSSVVALDFVNVSAESLLKTAKTMLQEQADEKELTLSVSSDSSLTVKGDLARCRQIILNLLDNAVKFTPEGGHVSLSASDHDDSFIRFTVSDTGPGVDPKEQKNIFSDFYQADHVRDAALGGSGIGLALSQRLVELHGGEMGIESKLGDGSTFWFTLPKWNSLLDETHSENGPIYEMDSLPTHRRILVVEDNETNVMVITKFLNIHHHEVTVARNGKEGVEKTRSFRPDFILMDIKMPVMDGLEATRLLKKIDGLKEIPIVALSASADSESIEESVKAGCDAHLAKPIESEKLFSVLQRFLG